MPRLEAIDCLRGAVMVLMALDHARCFLVTMPCDPTDLSRRNAALFLTRWVTHFCAPVFCFLAGVGAFLSMSRGRTRANLAGYLVSRGLWLVVLEFTVVQFSWDFAWNSQTLRCQVLWVLGCSMVVLAGMLFLPSWAVLAGGASLLILNHSLGTILHETALAHTSRVLLTSGDGMECHGPWFALAEEETWSR